MPDLMNPEFNDGKKEIMFWADSKCISCKNNGACALVQFIHDNTLFTYDGIHVASCDQYVPDVSSEFYIPDDADMEAIANVNAAALEKELSLLNRVLEKVPHVDIR